MRKKKKAAINESGSEWRKWHLWRRHNGVKESESNGNIENE